METKTSPITKDLTLGEVIEHYPDSLDVIYALFGGGCFTCPMYRIETVEQAALAHGLNPDEVVAELNRVMAAPPPPSEQITGDMTINDVLAAFPGTRPVFEALGIQHAQGNMTIAQAARLRDRDLEGLLSDVRSHLRR